jgi:hypothetical protein
MFEQFGGKKFSSMVDKFKKKIACVMKAFNPTCHLNENRGCGRKEAHTI